ncbi:MAG: F0F1 ATP synthase subunit beta, partial [Actinomycetes bacterium]
MTVTTEPAVGAGRVARVTGPVVDVEFPAESMPELNFALHTTVSFGGDEEGAAKDRLLTLEVALQIGDNMV